jgi:hypothetical protein
VKIHLNSLNLNSVQLGIVVHLYKPRSRKAGGLRIEVSLGYIARPYLKIKKNSILIQGIGNQILFLRF